MEEKDKTILKANIKMSFTYDEYLEASLDLLTRVNETMSSQDLYEDLESCR